MDKIKIFKVRPSTKYVTSINGYREGATEMISDRTRGKNAPVGKLAKPSDLESEDVVGSTPTRCTKLELAYSKAAGANLQNGYENRL